MADTMKKGKKKAVQRVTVTVAESLFLAFFLEQLNQALLWTEHFNFGVSGATNKNLAMIVFFHQNKHNLKYILG